MNYEYLQWGSFNHDDFIIGPSDFSFSANPHIKKIIACSRGLEDNLIQHSMNEKKSIKLTTKVFYNYYHIILHYILETNVEFV